MDKEKEIDKMVEIAREYSKDIANTPYYKGVVTDMTALYEAGYRKADEVRKETLKEIFSWLHIRTKNGRVIDDTVLIKTAKETFGVEVDE